MQKQVLANLTAVLEAGGSSIQNVVKVNIFLTTMTNFAAMNAVYAEVFKDDPKPVSCYRGFFANLIAIAACLSFMAKNKES